MKNQAVNCLVSCAAPPTSSGRNNNYAGAGWKLILTGPTDGYAGYNTYPTRNEWIFVIDLDCINRDRWPFGFKQADAFLIGCRGRHLSLSGVDHLNPVRDENAVQFPHCQLYYSEMNWKPVVGLWIQWNAADWPQTFRFHGTRSVLFTGTAYLLYCLFRRWIVRDAGRRETKRAIVLDWTKIRVLQTVHPTAV